VIGHMKLGNSNVKTEHRSTFAACIVNPSSVDRTIRGGMDRWPPGISSTIPTICYFLDANFDAIKPSIFE